MSTKRNQEAAGSEQPVVTAEAEELTYTADEFAKAAEAVFGKGTSPDIVRAAFMRSSLTEATVKKAKELVNAFAKKEVK